jgi:methylglutaconyl-CoA hydratase
MENIQTSIKDNIAFLCLNRPNKHNALNKEMILSINDFITKLKNNNKIRALIIIANGDNFCAGADIAWLAESVELSTSDNIADAKILSDMLNNLSTLPFHTVTYIHGKVIGGGLGLIAASDIVIADPETTFSAPEAYIGMVPAIITKFLVQRIGISHTKNMFITGEFINSNEAIKLGLVNKIELKANHKDHEKKLLKTILKTSQRAVSIIKSMFDDNSTNYYNGKKPGYEIMAYTRQHKDTQEKLVEFLQKGEKDCL